MKYNLVIRENAMLLSIFFAKTNSKNYRKTLAIARCIPFTEMKEGTVFIPFLIEKDVALYSYSIKRILSLAAKWKSFVLEMDDKPIQLIKSGQTQKRRKWEIR